MAGTKKSSKRIVDVAHPGKSAPSDTSKPVIVSNRPILKDPMMVDEAAETTPVTVKTDSKTVIQPLAETPDSKDHETKAEKPKIDSTKTIAQLAEEAKVRQEEEDEPESGAKEDDTKEVSEPDTPEEEVTDEPISDPAKIEQDEAAKEADEKKHDESIDKLVESKKYFLPINAAEKRRSRRVVIGGILLSLLLISAWADIAMDAGLIKSDGIPHTHYFDKSTVASDSPPTPAAITKVFKAPLAKLSFKYPSDWEVSSSLSNANLDNISMRPAGESDAHSNRVNVLFESPSADKLVQGRIIRYVSHQKLAASTKNITMYERDVVYQTESSGNYIVVGSIANDNLMEPEDIPSNYTAGFIAPNNSKANFSILVFGLNDNGKTGFRTLEEAKDYIKSDDYQKARRILISTTVTK